MGVLADRIGGGGQTQTRPSGGGSRPLTLSERLSGAGPGRVRVGEETLPTKELASRIAQLRAAGHVEDAEKFQRAFQDSIPDADLQAAGLSKIKAPSPSLLDRAGSLVGSALGVLDRPSQAVLRGVQAVKTGDNPLAEAFGGIAGRGDRVEVEDVLGNVQGGALGKFVAQTLTDPLTYLTFGAAPATRAGLRAIGRQFGDDVAESVARRGLRALSADQTAELARLVPEKTLQSLQRGARGGVKLGQSTLIGGEALRSPLRRARILDQGTRGSLRLGRAGTPQRTLQSALRGNRFVGGVGSRLRTREDIARTFGRTKADEVGLLTGRFRARVGSADEQAIDRINAARKAIPSKKRPEALKRVRDALEGRTPTRDIRRLREAGEDETADLLQEVHRTMVESRRARRLAGLDPDTRIGALPVELSTAARQAVARSPRARKQVEQLLARPEAGRAPLFDLSEAARAGRGPLQPELGDIGLTPPGGRAPALPSPDRTLEDLAKTLKKEVRELNDLDIEAILEMDPTRLAAGEALRANRAIEVDNLVDEAAEAILDPATGEPLLIPANREGAEELADELLLEKVTFGHREVYAPAEMLPELKRLGAAVFGREAPDAFGRFLDEYQRMWKGLATVPIVFGPAFHARNMLGNVFNNWLAGGIKAADYQLAAKLQRGYHQAQKIMQDPNFQRRLTAAGDDAGTIARGVAPSGPVRTLEDALKEVELLDDAERTMILEALEDGALTSGFISTDLVEEVLGRPDATTRLGQAKQQLTDPQKSLVIRHGAKLGELVENNARLAHYTAKRAQLGSRSEAMLSLKQALFDYQDLTQFERNVLRRIIPFYTFMRKNTPYQFQKLATEPRKALAAIRIQEVPGDREGAQGLALPSFMLEEGNVPLAAGLGGVLGGTPDQPVLAGLDLPVESAFESVEPFVRMGARLPGINRLPGAESLQGDLQQTAQDIVGLPGGGGTEILRTLVEQASGRDLFTGGPAKKPTTFQLAQDLIPIVAQGKGAVTGTIDSDTRLQTILNRLTGVDITQATERRQLGEILDRIRQVEGAVDDLPTITELREQGLLPARGGSTARKREPLFKF